MNNNLIKIRNLELEIIINQSLYNKKTITYDMYVSAREVLLKSLQKEKREE